MHDTENDTRNAGVPSRFGREADTVDVARLALDQALDSIIVHRPDGSIVTCNPAAARFLGMTLEEILASGPWGWTVAPPDVRDARMAELRRLGSLRFTSRARKSDGDIVITEVHVRWVDTADGPLIVAVTRDITEKTRAEEILKGLAYRDPLTGLANRVMLEDRLQVALSSARRHGHLVGVAFIDIDDFKPVNDTYGHDAGDFALQAFAMRLVQVVREEDTIARIGGDEFVAVFPRIESAADLTTVAEKLADAAHQPVEFSGHTISITVSIGLALSDARAEDERAIISRADAAMYEAKRHGLHISGVDGA